MLGDQLALSQLGADKLGAGEMESSSTALRKTCLEAFALHTFSSVLQRGFSKRNFFEQGGPTESYVHSG